MAISHAASAPDGPRERLLATASALFYEEGIHAVGIDRIVNEAGVPRATLYRHFAGKEGLVLAYLRGEDAAIRGQAAAAAAAAPERQLGLAIAAIAADIAQRHTRGCPFINAAAEYPDADSEVRGLIDAHRAWFRQTLAAAAEAAGVEDPDAAAAQLVMLRDAALVGGYLDGSATVAATFVSAATAVTGLDLA
ncbi:TetR/AcrR family transcriptional regulator [Demequina sp. NBRC 110057]|uniref:TetR/AcrR family transcriptional regulator n=1 Tax=Demequina sp. NBRC 110057 TaxID=1570346 RepID=UPI0011786FA5|nr:TetR/AcrR family transcriptional regulator [Demequina sp. NBRC 110057]